MDLSDVIADPLVRLQRKYYYLLWVPLLWLALPTALPVYLWGESPFASFILCVIARYTISLHVIWLVNSWAHLFGARPYNEKLALVEATSIRHLVIGEGFHNYHPAFPGDYSASEFVPADVFNPATLLIDCFASIGWVWNLKKADPELVQKIA
ncbi:PREDICTED: stearoyl-CoA desaturase 5-like, partial [Rhagoletis zephyria]|uniref:stearoyl-CoA desaturase 5-like n=1 Tax=Rhagoletis zephyria TaxID=28612 RepID=UPI000811935B